MDAAATVLYTFAMRPLVPWSRPEPFGAWVRLDDATLIAVDHDLAERLAVPHTIATRPGPTRPLELHVAVTSRCNAPCEGCYTDARPNGAEPPLDEIFARLRAARDAGVSTVALGGGEPLTRRDLARIAEEARALGLVPVMTTSGIGLTRERAAELRAFAQINVSHDGAGDGYRAVRGFDARDAAERAIETLAAAGITVGANVVLTRATMDLLGETATRVADKGAHEIQLLRYKPAGRAADLSYEDRHLTSEQVDGLWPAIKGLIIAGRLRVRIDCAMVPLLSAALIDELRGEPSSGELSSGGIGAASRVAETLAALGVFGCEAARHLAALRVDGSVAPCSFFSVAKASLARRPLPLQPGGSLDAWSTDAELERFRAYHASPAEPCRSCELFSICRGGCQVVSRHAARGAFAPDPECPRVRAHAEMASRPPPKPGPPSRESATEA